MAHKDNLPSDEIQQLLKSVVDHFDEEDRSVRDKQIRLWRRLKLYWDGFQRTWWSEIAHKVYWRGDGMMGTFGIKVFPDTDIRDQIEAHRKDCINPQN